MWLALMLVRYGKVMFFVYILCIRKPSVLQQPVNFPSLVIQYISTRQFSMLVHIFSTKHKNGRVINTDYCQLMLKCQLYKQHAFQRAYIQDNILACCIFNTVYAHVFKIIM
jgi:hypothetical protein